MARYAIGAGMALLALGCGPDSNVSEASCGACSGQRYSAEQCTAWGDESGCESSSPVDDLPGSCKNGCSFKNCASPPECAPMPPPDAATAQPDAATSSASDPECVLADEDGLFSRCPAACGECGRLMYNGLTRYTCPCGMPCPCGFRCGSIALPVGGTISGVCARP